MKRMYIQPRTILVTVAHAYGIMDNMTYNNTPVDNPGNIGWGKQSGNNGNGNGNTITIKDVWED